VLQAAGFSSKTIKEGLDKDYGLKEWNYRGYNHL
jgi:hypothetical protein